MSSGCKTTPCWGGRVTDRGLVFKFGRAVSIVVMGPPFGCWATNHPHLIYRWQITFRE